MPSETFRRQKERILTLYRAFVFQIADCPQNRCRVFGNQAVFDNAVVTRKVHQTFHAQSAQMVGNRCRRHGQGFGQLGNLAIAVQQLDQYSGLTKIRTRRRRAADTGQGGATSYRLDSTEPEFTWCFSTLENRSLEDSRGNAVRFLLIHYTLVSERSDTKVRMPETLFFLKHHDLHEKCRLKNISDGISSLRQ
ncbi:Uncharacterised protein [Neisseria meningitidis]|nr:Uncharacterised protein [Neisseria meningitidis]